MDANSCNNLLVAASTPAEVAERHRVRMRYAGDSEMPETTGERKIKVLALGWVGELSTTRAGSRACVRGDPGH